MENNNIKNEIMTILQNELPNEVARQINNVNNKNKEVENQKLNYLYVHVKDEIMNLLAYKYKYSSTMASDIVEKIVDDNKIHIEKLIDTSREDKNNENMYISSEILKRKSENIEIDDSDISNSINYLFSNSLNEIDQNIQTTRVEQDKMAYQIESSIKIGMMSQFKNWLNTHSIGRTDEILHELNHVFNDLSDNINGVYYETNKNIESDSIKEIENKFNEVINVYKKDIIEQENKEENTKNINEINKNNLDEKDIVINEIFEKINEYEELSRIEKEYLTKENNEKQIEDLPDDLLK